MKFAQIKKDFPLLQSTVDGSPIVYLDNASTAQKPQKVLDALTTFYTTQNANVHRGVYPLAEEATTAYEAARDCVARFINAQPHEIVFTRGTTDGINLFASSWARTHLQEGDEIVLTELEHHSNFVPWQQIARETGATVRVVPINLDGTLQMEQLHRFISHKTKLVTFSHINHVVGTQQDVHAFVKAARSVGALVLLDAAQSVAHKQLDVKQLDVDVLVFSGHKIFGPTGIGVLYMKEAIHKDVPPFQYGGGMVYDVSLTHGARFLKAPYRYEAGTPPIAQAVGLAAALEYVHTTLSWDPLQTHEAGLVSQLITELEQMERVTVLGPVEQLKQSGHLASFVVSGIHGHDVAAFLGQYGICVRAGHHCAQPLARRLGIDASVRVSFAAYNTSQDVTAFVQGMRTLLATL